MRGQEINCFFGHRFNWSMDAPVTIAAHKDDVDAATIQAT